MMSAESDMQLERKLNGALSQLIGRGPENRARARRLAEERDALLVNCDGIGPTPVPRPLSAEITATLEAILSEAEVQTALGPAVGATDAATRQQQQVDARAAKFAAERAAREAAEDVEVGSILPQTEALAAFDDMIERITPSPSPSHKSPASRDNSPAGRRSFKSQSPQQQPQPQNEFERAHMASIARKPMTASVLSKAGLS